MTIVPMMIAIVITMMVSTMPNIIQAGIVGVVSGLICALITWIIKPRPNVRICREISHETKPPHRYVFKIQNLGADDISIPEYYVTLFYKGEFYNIKGIQIPVLFSKRKAKRLAKINNKALYTFEQIVPIDVQKINKDTLHLKANDETLSEKYTAEKLSITDFIDKDPKLEIRVILTAVSLRYNTTQFFSESLEVEICEEDYREGEHTIIYSHTPRAD